MGDWKRKPYRDQLMKIFPNLIRKYRRKIKKLCKYCHWKNFSTLTKTEKKKSEDELRKNFANFVIVVWFGYGSNDPRSILVMDVAWSIILFIPVYNRLNLMTNTRLRGGMLSVNGRSHVLRHVLRHVTERIVESWKGAQLRELRWLSWVGKGHVGRINGRRDVW